MNASLANAIASDPAVFRQHLLIETDDGDRRLCDVVDPWQESDFAAFDPAMLHLAGRKRSEEIKLRLWKGCSRGHSKTTDLAVMLSYVLAFSLRRLRLVAGAGDRDQAKLLRDAISTLCSKNPWLASLLKVDLYKVTGVKSGSTLDILSADAKTSYGLTPHLVVCDELTHWPNDELWNSLFSSVGKKRDAALLIITNAGAVSSWQWDVREVARTSPQWHFIEHDGPQASWITQAMLDEQMAMLTKEAYDRLWLNRWSTGEGGPFSRDMFRYYEFAGGEYHLDSGYSLPMDDAWTCLSVDLAISEKRVADYTVIQCWRVWPEGEACLVDQHKARMNFPKTIDTIESMESRHAADLILVEDVQYQRAAVQQLRRQGLRVVGVRPKGDKIARAQTGALRIEAGTVFWPRRASWLADFEAEHLAFPESKHDDQVDAESQALIEISRRYGNVSGAAIREAREARELGVDLDERGERAEEARTRFLMGE